MKRIFRRARYLPGAVLCLLANLALAEVAGRATVIDGDTPVPFILLLDDMIR